MWIKFTAKLRFAIKIFVGGVNVISGEKHSEDDETLRRQAEKLAAGKSIQDYVVVPGQEWLDGIASADGEVRQFVAMPYGEGYSVEAQLTGDESVGGIQFEVTPAIRQPKNAPAFRHGHKAKGASHTDMQIYIRTLTGETLSLVVDKEYTIDTIREMIHDIDGTPPSEQRLIFAGMQLEVGKRPLGASIVR